MKSLSPALRLAHTLAMTRPEVWRRKELLEWAREALRERDALALRVHELEKAVKSIPRFQGMTELA